MIRPAALLLFLPLLAARAADAPVLALGDGERLTYKVAWAVLPGAGIITVSAAAATDPTGAPLLRVVSTTATHGLARLILPFDARAESLFDAATGRLLWLGESSSTRKKKASHTVVFDYAKGVADYVNSTDSAKVAPLPIDKGALPTDLITCLMETRRWNLRPGQARDAVVLFDDEFFELTVHALGYETIYTPLGAMNTVVLQPRMERTPPKGMFKRGSTVKVWISKERNPLPVRFRVDFSVGAGTATLADYRPPGPPAK